MGGAAPRALCRSPCDDCDYACNNKQYEAQDELVRGHSSHKSTHDLVGALKIALDSVHVAVNTLHLFGLRFQPCCSFCTNCFCLIH